MAQYDIKLHQNLASTGVEFQEQTITPNAVVGQDALLGFTGTSQTPTIIKAGAGSGLIVAGGAMGISIPNSPSGTSPTGSETVFIWQGGSLKNITVNELISGADELVAVTDGDTPGVLNDVLAVTGALNKSNAAGVMSLSVDVATGAQQGVVQIGTNINVSSGTISVSDANGSATKGVLRLSATDANGLNINLGVLSIDKATGTGYGVVQIGDNISVTDGEISVAFANGTTTFGVVKLNSILDDGLYLTNGEIGVYKGSKAQFGVVKGGDYINFSSDGVFTVQEATTAQKGVAQFNSDYFDVASGVVSLNNDYLEVVSAPATWDDLGTAGSIAIDDDYIYFCVATNVWKRTSIAKWS